MGYALEKRSEDPGQASIREEMECATSMTRDSAFLAGPKRPRAPTHLFRAPDLYPKEPSEAPLSHEYWRRFCENLTVLLSWHSSPAPPSVAIPTTVSGTVMFLNSGSCGCRRFPPVLLRTNKAAGQRRISIHCHELVLPFSNLAYHPINKRHFCHVQPSPVPNEAASREYPSVLPSRSKPITIANGEEEKGTSMMMDQVTMNDGTDKTTVEDAAASIESLDERIHGIITSLEPRQFDTSMAKKSIAERTSMMKHYGQDLEDLSRALASIDFSAMPTLFEKDLGSRYTKVLDDAAKHLSDAIQYMEAASSTSIRQDGLTNQGIDVVSRTSRRRRAQESYQGNNYGDQFRQQYDTKGHNDFKHKFGQGFKVHPKVEHLHKIQDSILNGDHAYLNRLLSSIHKQHSHAPPSARRASSFHHGRRMNFEPTGSVKFDQCRLLVECTSRMSLYDLLIFYISDDINPGTGEIDTSVLVFDEVNLVQKQATKKQLTSSLKAAFDSGATLEQVNGDCDTLLELFHRTIEFDGLPRWEGAMVNQVCLAEGTVVFVQLQEIFLKVDPVFITYEGDLPGFNEAQTNEEGVGASFFLSFETLKPLIEDILRANFPDAKASLANEIFMDALQCANDLFNSDDRVNSDDGRHSGEENIFMAGNQFKIPIEVSRDPSIRDEHGQLISNLNSGLVTANVNDLFDQAFEKVVREFYDCLVSIFDGILDSSEFNECMQDAYNDIYEQLFEQFTKGLELVFGDKPSLGFICGIKEAVREDGATLPGLCCIDAPYQLDEDYWGSEYQCEVDDGLGSLIPNPCERISPYFGKISEESCKVYGGTYCPLTDCTRLQECVAELIDIARNENRTAFANYLLNAPNITDPENSFQCGWAREYFGFPANFINDNQICEDIKQFRNSRDFEFLEEFFNQGSSSDEPGDDDDNFNVVPPLVLVPPDPENRDATEAVSKKAEVQNGQAWRATNFALESAAKTLNSIYDAIKDSKCPCGGPFCVAGDVCKLVQNIAQKITVVGLILIETSAEISKFTYGEVAELGNVEPIQTGERVKAIYDNMVLTGNYLQRRFQGVNDYLERMENRLVRALAPPSAPGPAPETVASPSNPNITFVVRNGVGCDGLDQDGDSVEDNCEEDRFPPSLRLTSKASTSFVCEVDYCLEERFRTQTEAITFLNAVFDVVDDCSAPEFVQKVIEQNPGTVCEKTRFEIIPVQTFPENSTCADVTLPGISAIVELGLDTSAPTVLCGFQVDRSDDDRRVSPDSKTLVIPSERKSSFVDTLLFQTTADNCPGPLRRMVTVQSNEFVYGTNSVVLINQENTEDGSVVPRLFVNPQSCADGSQDDATICDPDPVSDFRFYEVKISVTDAVGNEAVDTCRVIVEPSRRRNLAKQTKDSQRSSSESGKGSKKIIPIEELLLKVAESNVRYTLATVTTEVSPSPVA
eukprot:scaffold3471_cov175-Amphora_coffeaeformis.AAC.12